MFYASSRSLLTSCVLFFVVACGGTKLDSAQEALERPPRIVDFSTYNETYPDQAITEESETESASDGQMENFDVLLTSQAGENTTLAIVQPYDKAWEMVVKALNHEAYEITDRDRDQGILYISYDPDYEKSGWDKTTGFFLGESALISEFHLKLTDVDTITEITAELVNDELDDEEYADPDVEVEKFLLDLYDILRHQ